jgi:DNA-directed RNA polymerase specialized sigma24 family protein
VELVRLYSNLSCGGEKLRRVRRAATARMPREGPKRSKQHHRRLGPTEVTQLIKAYGEQASVKELAQSIGIHRVTVTALLRRHRVELRLAGLEPEEIQAAARLHSEGWSLARLGEKFGVDPATVWRALRKASDL